MTKFIGSVKGIRKLGTSKLGLQFLHPKILQHCRVAFRSSQFDDAIFNALKTIEEEIRARIRARASDVGVELISKAMNSKSPQLIFSAIDAEQEAAHLLYRGAIGFFKNPLSHRFLGSQNPLKAFEILCLASLLMHILDDAKDLHIVEELILQERTKLEAIKLAREITGWDLLRAKRYVDSVWGLFH